MTEVATQRLWYDADKTKLVPDGSSEARFLAVAPGDEIPEGFKAPAGAKADAAKFEADRVKQAEKDAADVEAARLAAEQKAAKDAIAEEKAAEAAANKAAASPANKSGVTITRAPKAK